MALSRTQKKGLVTAIKLIVMVAIFGFIFYQLSKEQDPWATIVRGFTSPWCLLGVLLYGIPMLGMALRWMILMRSLGMPIPYRRSAEYFFIGQFFNTFALGSVGGDAARAWYVVKDFPDRKAAAALTVMMDRVIGMGALGLNAVIGVIVGLSMGLPSAGQVAWIVFSIMGLIIFVIVLVFWPPLRRALHLAKLVSKLPGKKFFAHCSEALALYEGKHKVLIWTVLISIFDQAIGIVCVWLMGIGFGMPANPLLYLLFVPLAWMIAAIPATPGGLGTLEGALVTLFVQALGGAVKAAATGMALMNRVMLIFWGLPGAIIYVFIGRHPAKEELEQVDADALPRPNPSAASRLDPKMTRA